MVFLSTRVLGLCLCIPLLAHAHTPVIISDIGVPYMQTFNDYRGSAATVPNGFFVEWDVARVADPFTGIGLFEVSDPSTSYGGFTAYTQGAGTHYSFGIREREPVDLRDARLYLHVTNTTGQAITGFLVSYDVEAWYIGHRRNRIRLKYDDQFGGGRFEEDIFSTDNPSSETAPGTKVNGALSAHRTSVSGFVNLATYLDPDGEPFGVLPDGADAYFRWQISNAAGDSGDLRAGLAINNVIITPVAEPVTVPTNVVALVTPTHVLTTAPPVEVHATLRSLSNGMLAIGYGTTRTGEGWTWHDAALMSPTSPYYATNAWTLPQPGIYYCAARWQDGDYTYYGVNPAGSTNMTTLHAEVQIIVTNTVPPPPLVITEVMSRSENTNAYVAGDWFEIYNAGAADVDLSGYSWYDDKNEPGVVVFPSGTMIPAYGTLIVTDNPIGTEQYFITGWDMFTRAGTSNVLHMGDSVPGLGRMGDEVHLYTPDGLTITSVSFGPTTNGYTFEWDIFGNYLGITQEGLNGAWRQPTDGQGGPGFDVGSPGVVVPEPWSLGLLIACAAFMLRRQRHGV